MQTEIQIRYTISASIYSEPGWRAELVEDGQVVWPDCYGFSPVSPDEARSELLEKLDKKTVF